MKKIILIAAMAVISVAATAQNLKFGYVNYTELVQLVPEMDTVREQLEAQERETYETLGAMYEEYQTKAQQFQQKESTWTPAIRDSKLKELQEIEARFQESQQIFQQELQQMQQMLQAPVYEKAQTVIKELAKAKGLAFVLEETSMIYIDPAQGVNLTPEARTALNIPEGRTIETLQAELQADGTYDVTLETFAISPNHYQYKGERPTDYIIVADTSSSMAASGGTGVSVFDGDLDVSSLSVEANTSDDNGTGVSGYGFSNPDEDIYLKHTDGKYYKAYMAVNTTELKKTIGIITKMRQKYYVYYIADDGLYLLDEPENSLSAALQARLADFLADSARFYGCQFIISTHSPFLLAMKGARIYDLDASPARVRQWSELENVRAYFELFEARYAVEMPRLVPISII